MEDIPKQYDPKSIENRWYDYWVNNEHFEAERDPDKEPFVIMMPPPNVTGKLHMGHALQSSVQDAVTRLRRMQGYDTLWLPGTDHAGIATQNVVEKNLRENEGVTRHDLGREEFVNRVWDWKEKYGEIIINQMKKLGTSCDWSRERFTMDDGLSKAVQHTFIELHRQGLIYKGNYLVNWCPVDQTAISDEEVDHIEQEGKLWYVKYKLDDETAKKTGEDFVEIATTRPETIPADTGIAVNPEDERFAKFIGGHAIVPTNGRVVSIIGDEEIKSDFGTGALKVTPAHDQLDFEIGNRNGLDIINIINIDGMLNENAGQYGSMDRFEAREKVVKDLENQGHISRTEDYTTQVGISSRSKALIEPLLSEQWFVKMEPLAKMAKEASEKGDVEFFPPRWENEYFRWLDNIRDWVISRQLWWGHRIPVWYYTKEDGSIDRSRDYIVSIEQPEEGMVQDQDVLDTWFSSWLWPFSTLGWPDKTKDLEHFYPTSLLVSGYDILFFWIARMIMAGLKFTDQAPFHDVFITGMVKDKYGRWMSKSLGNGIDPIEMIDKYGSDAVRYCLIVLCAQGQDIKLDPTKFEMGRNFANKIWNAFRFLALNMEEDKSYDQELDVENGSIVDRWMMTRIQQTLTDVEDDLSRYRLNEALMKIYSLVWDDFCDWYIELIKADEPGQPIPEERLAMGIQFLEVLMKMLHPYMPFITEEIWQKLKTRSPEDALIVSSWPEIDDNLKYEKQASDFSHIQKIISAIRNIRSEMRLSPKAELDLHIQARNQQTEYALNTHSWIMYKLQSLASINVSSSLERPKASASAVVEGSEIYIPLEGHIDFDKEKERIQKEIDRIQGFVKSVNAKLSNEQFLENAPTEVVNKERQKKEDAELNLDKLHGIMEDLSS